MAHLSFLHPINYPNPVACDQPHKKT
jgi:hypothetical protein